MIASLLKRYDRQIPRYTSYPTAPQFHDGIDARTYAHWLSELGDKDTLSLYFHVPFCAEMCWFCGCHTKVSRRYDPIAAYVRHMLAEIDLVADAVTSSPPITSAHWGGGSPTKLEPDDFRRLMARARDRFVFAENAEIAVEIDPRTLTPDFTSAMREAGVNRASIGVQDFDSRVQSAINRVQSYELVRETARAVRAAGIDALNFDLIYGLPYQTVESIERSVDLAVSLNPNRLSVFGYAHVPWMKSHQKMIPDEVLPDNLLRFEQREALGARLVEHGYRQIGLDHFARPDDEMAVTLDEGGLRRNFQGYTVDDATALIGIGASSIGRLRQGYVQNHVPMKAYGDAIEAGQLPIARGVALSEDDRIRGSIIERLMCELAVDLSEYGGVEPWHAEMRALEPFEDDRIVRVIGSRIEVTELGRPFLRLICAVFDAYLAPEIARYSQAI